MEHKWIRLAGSERPETQDDYVNAAYNDTKKEEETATTSR